MKNYLVILLFLMYDSQAFAEAWIPATGYKLSGFVYEPEYTSTEQDRYLKLKSRHAKFTAIIEREKVIGKKSSFLFKIMNESIKNTFYLNSKTYAAQVDIKYSKASPIFGWKQNLYSTPNSSLSVTARLKPIELFISSLTQDVVLHNSYLDLSVSCGQNFQLSTEANYSFIELTAGNKAYPKIIHNEHYLNLTLGHNLTNYTKLYLSLWNNFNSYKFDKKPLNKRQVRNIARSYSLYSSTADILARQIGSSEYTQNLHKMQLEVESNYYKSYFIKLSSFFNYYPKYQKTSKGVMISLGKYL